MTYAIVAGMVGMAAALIAVVVMLLITSNRLYNRGEETFAARTAQAEAERLRREAEDTRDSEKVGRSKAEGERDQALAQLAAVKAAGRTVVRAQEAELKEQIDAGTEADLVALSRHVLGGSLPSPVSGAGAATAAGAGGDQAGPAAVPGPG